MKTIKEIAKAVLDECEYSYEEQDELIRFGVKGDNCMVRINILCREERKVMLVIGTLDVFVSEDKRTSVLTLLNRQNSQTLFTTLYLDPEDGQIMCRSACNADGGSLNENVANYALSVVIEMLDDVFKPIMRIQLGIEE